jgi:nitroimidazol reductase NimA-like FMN-containing flavoprotein (pyridoxamine 5'-phosphate oxidase superfamily)
MNDTSRAGRNAGSVRTRIRRHPERSITDVTEFAAILRAGFVAHVGFVMDGQPFVILMTYHFDGADPTRLYLRGAHQSRLLEHLATGAPVCVSVMLLDGLVYSRTAEFHSVNYRSVVVFGRAAPELDMERKRQLLESIIARYHPGRAAGRDYEPIPDAHLKTTALVALEIEEWSAKSREGGPKGPRDADATALGSAGVVALASR